MPKLPDKFDLGGAPSPGRRPIVQAPAFDSGGGLMVANEVVKGIGGLAKVAIAKQEEADDYELQKSIVDFDLEQEKRLDDAKRNAPPEAKDFTGSYRRGYDEAATGLMTKVPDRLKPKVDEMLVRRGAAFEKRAYDFELAERDRWNIQDVQKNTSDLITHTMGKPEAMDDNAQRGVAIIRASPLPVRQKIDAERKFLDTNAEFGIKAMIDREIEAGRDAGDVIERLRRVPRGSMPKGLPGVDMPSSPGAWKIYDKDVPTPAERKAIFNGGGVVVNLDTNWAASSKPTSPMVVIPDGATSEQRQAAEAYATGIAQLYNDKFGTDLKPRVVTRSQNGRGRPGTIHTEPFSVNDTRAVEFFTSDEGRKAHAGLLRETFGKVSGVAFSLPHDETRKGDKGAVGPRGSEVDIARALIADLKGSDEPRLVEGPSEVTRKDLGPVQVAQASTGRMTDAGPDTGTALTKDGADTAGQGGSATLDGGAVDDGGPKDDLEEADQAEWGYMSPTTRRKLINYARTAGRAVVTKGVDDDIARLRLGREPVAGPDGKTSLDRARAHMTNFQWATKKREWDEAGLERKEVIALRQMPLNDAADHVATIIDRAEQQGLSVDSAAKVQKKAERTWEKMIDMSNKDPVRLVTGSLGDEADDRTPPFENVARVMKLFKENRAAVASTGPDGPTLQLGAPGRGPKITDSDDTTTIPGRIGQAPIPPQEQWRMLFDARLADQRTLMPDDEHKHRRLNAREAEQLLQLPKNKELDRKAYRTHLEQAWERAQKKFPPEHADKAFKEALSFHHKGADVDGVKAEMLSKLIKGRPLTNTDFQRMRSLEQIDGTSLSSGIDVMARIDRAGRSQGMPAIAPMGDAGRPAIGQGMAQPSPKQMEWLQANPDGWQAFDQRFGKGAAARALSGGPGNDPWGNRRQAVPKRDWRDDEKNIQPKSGWGFFGR